MPDWFTDFLCGVSLELANGIWNLCMSLVKAVMVNTPQTFSSSAWSFVNGTVYPWALSLGISLLNLFFIISMWQAVKNFHQNITLEMTVEALIKIVAANVIFVNLKNIITLLFKVSSLMTQELFVMQIPELKVEDIDIGSVLFYQLFGIFFVLAAIVCGFMILMTVYGRYIKLYILMIMAPFAVPTLIGGHGLENTFYSWLKTFLLNVFEIVVIALVMVIGWKICEGGISFLDGNNIVTGAVDGFWDALNALFTMVFLTTSVKGANSLLSKAFGL